MDEHPSCTWWLTTSRVQTKCTSSAPDYSCVLYFASWAIVDTIRVNNRFLPNVNFSYHCNPIANGHGLAVNLIKGLGVYLSISRMSDRFAMTRIDSLDIYQSPLCCYLHQSFAIVLGVSWKLDLSVILHSKVPKLDLNTAVVTPAQRQLSSY